MKTKKILGLFTGLLLGQTQPAVLLTLSVQSTGASRGTTIPIKVSLSKISTGVTDPSGLLFSTVFDSSKLLVQSATLNPAITGKQITCKQNIKGYTCIIAGLNQNSIPPGLLCTLTISIKNGAPLGPAAIMILNTQGVTPSGIPEPAGGGIGIISIK
jgi:hypothetical protein